MLFAQDNLGVRFGPGEIAVIGLLLGSVVSALVYLGKLLLAAKDAQLEKALEDIKDYRAIAADASKAALLALAARNAATGQTSPASVVPVVPERHSPLTDEQIATAQKATLRAQVTAVMLELGQPARTVHDEVEPILPNGLTVAPVVPVPAPIVQAGDKVKVMVEGEIVPEADH